MLLNYNLNNNINLETGIRYGVINSNQLASWFFDKINPIFPTYEPNNPDHCEEEFNDNPIGWELNDSDYTIEMFDDGDIFITKSPYVTMGNFCSPCAPGAVDLMGGEGSIKAYCFNEDWFEDKKIPYKCQRI